MTKLGKNTDDIRYSNSLLLVNYFRKGEFFCKEIAQQSGLCNAAVEKIADELLQLNLIRESTEPKKKTVGRAPIYYKINEDLGILATVDLTNSRIELNDFEGNLIDGFNFDVGMSEIGHRYSEKDILQIIEKLKEMLKAFPSKKLLALSVVTFGRIDKKSGNYLFISQSVNLPDKNLKELFSALNVPVIIDNDVDLAVVAERETGALSKRNDCSFFIKIGEGIACSTLIGGKVVSGCGLAGEIGYNKVFCTLTNSERQISDCISLYGISKLIQLSGGKEFPPLKITELYKNNSDKILVETVNYSAKILANLLKNLVDILDFQTIVIAGEVVNFGDCYLKIINDYLNENCIGKARAQFSKIKNDTLLGAKMTAMQFVVKKVLTENRKK